MNNISCMKPNKTSVVIGLIGTHKGVGVTHTGIMLSNYISEKINGKTAFLECNENNDFRYLQMAYESLDESELTKRFNIYNVTYYMNVRDDEVTEILNEDYEYFILDLGTEFQASKKEFLRSDIKLIIGSLTEWKREYLMSFFKSTNYYHLFEKWKYLIVFGHVEEIKELRKQWDYSIYPVPFEPDPFVLSKNSLKFFQKIW